MQKNLIIISIIAITLFMTACEPHRIDIQQGNKVTPENYARLKTGMNRNQVLFVLGSPLLKDPFHQHRWDYIYYLKPGNNEIKQSRLTLYFEGDELIRIDDSAYRPEAHGDKAKIEDLDSNDLPPTLAQPLE
ncbi:MAG: outer membrane protein assembly factor BamE [Gammaproteobacteria bacterium]|nr:outer membrane protein assembly factor BamE [Gammaproteobacteria bacterium]